MLSDQKNLKCSKSPPGLRAHSFVCSGDDEITMDVKESGVKSNDLVLAGRK